MYLLENINLKLNTLVFMLRCHAFIPRVAGTNQKMQLMYDLGLPGTRLRWGVYKFSNIL